MSTPWQPLPKMHVHRLSRKVTSNCHVRSSSGSGKLTHSWAPSGRRPRAHGGLSPWRCFLGWLLDLSPSRSLSARGGRRRVGPLRDSHCCHLGTARLGTAEPRLGEPRSVVGRDRRAQSPVGHRRRSSRSGGPSRARRGGGGAHGVVGPAGRPFVGRGALGDGGDLALQPVEARVGRPPRPAQVLVVVVVEPPLEARPR